jgi:uncharacterized protein with HEPN domain
MKGDRLYVGHILLAAKDIKTYVSGSDFDVFSRNTLLQDGIIRKLEIIGEASKRLTPEFRDALPDIPWKDVIGMRNKLVHDYFGVNLEAVWETATVEVPELRGALEIIQVEESSDQPKKEEDQNDEEKK